MAENLQLLRVAAVLPICYFSFYSGFKLLGLLNFRFRLWRSLLVCSRFHLRLNHSRLSLNLKEVNKERSLLFMYLEALLENFASKFVLWLESGGPLELL